MRSFLLNLCVAAALVALAFAGCQRPADVDGRTVYGRRAIDLMAEGDRYEKEKNYRMALDRYSQALELSPRPALYYRIGACHYSLGEYNQARENLNTALQFAPDYPAAQYLLSKVRIQLELARRRGTPPAVATARPTATRPPIAATKTPVRTEVAVVTPERTRPPQTPTMPTPVVTKPPTPRPTVRPTERPTVRPTVRPTPTETRRPTATIGPTPGRVMPTAVATRVITPVRTRPRPTEARVRTPDVPVFPVTPPSTIEPIDPNGAGGLSEGGPLPALSPEDIEKIFSETNVSDLDDNSTTGPHGGDVPLLGQWTYHWNNAKSFMDRGLHEEAVDELLICIGIRWNHVDSHLMLADAYDKVGRGEKALKHYEIARVLAPSQPKPYFRTGNYYLRHAIKGERASFYNDALRYYNLALRVDPKYHEAYHNAAIVYMKLRDYTNSRKVFEKALQIKPDYAKAHRNLGLLYEQYLNNPAAARRHYQEAIRLGVEDADVVREYLNALP